MSEDKREKWFVYIHTACRTYMCSICFLLNQNVPLIIIVVQIYGIYTVRCQTCVTMYNSICSAHTQTTYVCVDRYIIRGVCSAHQEHARPCSVSLHQQWSGPLSPRERVTEVILQHTILIFGTLHTCTYINILHIGHGMG